MRGAVGQSGGESEVGASREGVSLGGMAGEGGCGEAVSLSFFGVRCCRRRMPTREGRALKPPWASAVVVW